MAHIQTQLSGCSRRGCVIPTHPAVSESLVDRDCRVHESNQAADQRLHPPGLAVWQQNTSACVAPGELLVRAWHRRRLSPVDDREYRKRQPGAAVKDAGAKVQERDLRRTTYES
jgi:hypothetical protein